MREDVTDKKSTFIILLLIGNLALSGGLSYIIIGQNAQISGLRKDYVGLKGEVEGLNRRLENPRFTFSNVSVDSYNAPSRVYRMVERSVVQVSAVIMTFTGKSSVTGSGFVYDEVGHIVTNAHVVRDSEDIRVTFLNGTILSASLSGIDVYSDLAVVKVDAPTGLLTPVILGDSSTLSIGEPVLAVGNPFGLSGSITSGIVSQLDRILPSEGGYSIVGVIQVDAAVNPGNSGGPLLNYRGEVVGVTTAIVSRTGEFSGVGFAIPSNLVKKVVPFLIVEGAYQHPWLGITGVEVTPEIAEAMNLEETKGVLVTSIVEGGPADRAGLRAGEDVINLDGEEINVGGDIIVGIGGSPVTRMNDILVHLEYFTVPGEVVTLEVLREGELLTLQVRLGERPPAE